MLVCAALNPLSIHTVWPTPCCCYKLTLCNALKASTRISHLQLKIGLIWMHKLKRLIWNFHFSLLGIHVREYFNHPTIDFQRTISKAGRNSKVIHLL